MFVCQLVAFAAAHFCPLYQWRSSLLEMYRVVTKSCYLQYYWSCCSWKVVFWSKMNPHFYEELERNPPHAMVWVGMDMKWLFGPYSFDGPVYQYRYFDMLKNWLMPELENIGIRENAWFEQDGALAHFAITVRGYLSEVFPECWFCRGSPVLLPALGRPRHSPDLSIPYGAT
jgi:hypothetical protein